MSTPIRYIHTGGEAEIEVKRSRFIAALAPVTDEESAAAFIDERRRLHRQARHNCSAFVIGNRSEITRCSDDGEPPHTAGRPMLDVLLGAELHDVCVVVTRYFGGILLGTGGLVRAYQSAVQAGIEACVTGFRRLGIPVTIRADYTDTGRIGSFVAEHAYPTLSVDYAESVTYRLLIPPEDAAAVRTSVLDLSRGKIDPEMEDLTWYRDVEGTILLP